MRRFFRILGWAFLIPVGLTVTYLTAAAAGGLIPCSVVPDSGPRTIDIYIHSNGVHADLLLPVKTAEVDWRQRLSFDDPDVADGSFPYLAFGWGDKAFYLTTPTWSDLKLSTALRALSGFDDTVMHVQAANALPPEPRSRRLTLTAEQYHRLVDYIERSLAHDPANAPIPIEGAHYYGRHDAFYEARGHYSAFNTCNEWTRRALAAAGQPTALWAPFDAALFQHIRA